MRVALDRGVPTLIGSAPRARGRKRGIDKAPIQGIKQRTAGRRLAPQGIAGAWLRNRQAVGNSQPRGIISHHNPNRRRHRTSSRFGSGSGVRASVRSGQATAAVSDLPTRQVDRKEAHPGQHHGAAGDVFRSLGQIASDRRLPKPRSGRTGEIRRVDDFAGVLRPASWPLASGDPQFAEFRQRRLVRLVAIAQIAAFHLRSLWQPAVLDVGEDAGHAGIKVTRLLTFAH